MRFIEAFLAWCVNAESRLFAWVVSLQIRQAGLSPHELHTPVGRIAYLDSGAAPGAEVMLLLHGAGADKRTWLPFAKALFERARKPWRLIVLDLPGHGDSVGSLTLDYSVPAQAQCLQAFLQALQLGPVSVVGNSMGGAIALRWAHQHPREVKALVLIDSAGATSRPSAWAQQLAREGFQATMGVRSVADYRRNMALAMVRPLALPGFALRALTREKMARTVLDQKVMDDIEHSLDQRDILASIHAPTLILWGREDRILPVDDADGFERAIPGSLKVVLDGIGHVPMVECPQETAQLCLYFLDQQRAEWPATRNQHPHDQSLHTAPTPAR